MQYIYANILTHDRIATTHKASLLHQGGLSSVPVCQGGTKLGAPGSKSTKPAGLHPVTKGERQMPELNLHPSQVS